MNLIRIRTKTDRGAEDGWLEVSLEGIVCYGRTSPQGSETVWLKNSMIVSVVDGTCDMLRRAIQLSCEADVVSCVPPVEQSEPTHSVTAEGLVRMPDGTPGVKMRNDWAVGGGD